MKVGDRVAKNHVYAGLIAQGGFASVSLVVRREGEFERLYALKRPHPHMLADDEMRRHFLEEGRIAGLLRHANVVSVLDVGEDAHGPYMLMPFVDGVPLATIVRRAAKAGDLLPVSVVLQIVDQAAKGLSAAHELRDHDGEPVPLVHRDVSPQNILVEFNGNVLILDFGIAKVLSGGGETTANLLKGKFGYMAPEQLRFESVTPQTDLYSLGVVLYEALAARRLHSSKDVTEIAQSVLKGPPPDITEARSDTPEQLDRLIFELLAKDPGHRPASARAVSERLREIAHGLYGEGDWIELSDYMRDEFGAEREERQDDRKATLTAARRLASRRWMLPAAAVAVGVVGLALGAIAVAHEGEPDPQDALVIERIDGTPDSTLTDSPAVLIPVDEVEVIAGMEPLDDEPAGDDANADPAIESTEEASTEAPRMSRRSRMRPNSSANHQGSAANMARAADRGVTMDWW